MLLIYTKIKNILKNKKKSDVFEEQEVFSSVVARNTYSCQYEIEA
jgi:hypothetical protein